MFSHVAIGAYLPILAGIQPAELRRKGATLRLARRAQANPGHLLHLKLASVGEQRARLKSRRPFAPAALELLHAIDNTVISAATWTDHDWQAEWRASTCRLRNFVAEAGARPPGLALPRASWVRLNRLRTGVGRFRSILHKWGVASSGVCDCGTGEQTADHVILDCPVYGSPGGMHGLADLDDGTLEWLADTCPHV